MKCFDIFCFQHMIEICSFFPSDFGSVQVDISKSVSLSNAYIGITLYETHEIQPGMDYLTWQMAVLFWRSCLLSKWQFAAPNKIALQTQKPQPLKQSQCRQMTALSATWQDDIWFLNFFFSLVVWVCVWVLTLILCLNTGADSPKPPNFHWILCVLPNSLAGNYLVWPSGRCSSKWQNALQMGVVT